MNNDNGIFNLRIVPFQVFQAHCDERRFIYSGNPGNFHVHCRLENGPQKCNNTVCPIWNSDRVRSVPENLQSLRDLNLVLKLKSEVDNGSRDVKAVYVGSEQGDTTVQG